MKKKKKIIYEILQWQKKYSWYSFFKKFKWKRAHLTCFSLILSTISQWHTNIFTYLSSNGICIFLFSIIAYWLDMHMFNHDFCVLWEIFEYLCHILSINNNKKLPFHLLTENTIRTHTCWCACIVLAFRRLRNTHAAPRCRCLASLSDVCHCDAI